MNKKDRSRYDDIIDLSRPESPKHKPMSREERAAQFAPFAALTGYDETIRQAGENFRFDDGIEYEGDED